MKFVDAVTILNNYAVNTLDVDFDSNFDEVFDAVGTAFVDYGHNAIPRVVLQSMDTVQRFINNYN